MNSKVKVTANEAGAVVNVSKNNPEYGHIRFEQSKIVFSRNGWVKKKKLSALIAGTVEELKELELFNGQELEGNIVIIEQLEPFSDHEPERHYKIAGETGIVCCVDGQPIYRKCFYDQTGQESDKFEQHTNVDDIVKANNKKLSEEINKRKESLKKDKKAKEVTKEEEEVADDNFEL